MFYFVLNFPVFGVVWVCCLATSSKFIDYRVMSGVIPRKHEREGERVTKVKQMAEVNDSRMNEHRQVGERERERLWKATKSRRN